MQCSVAGRNLNAWRVDFARTWAPKAPHSRFNLRTLRARIRRDAVAAQMRFVSATGASYLGLS